MLQVLPRLGIGGVERGTTEIAEAIVAAGGRALVAAEPGPLAARVERAGGEVVAMNAASKNPFDLWQNAGALARLIREEGVDVVHARSRAPAWSAWLASRRTGVPFVTTYHGAYRENVPLKRRYNAVMAYGRPTIAISEHIRDLVLARHGLDPSDVVTIPRGADMDVFATEAVGAERTERLARAWGVLDDARPIVMLPGRLTRWKGADVLLKATYLLTRGRCGVDFSVVLVGGDTSSGFSRRLARRIEEGNFGHVIRLVGEVQDMPAAYKLASVVVSPSLEPEAFGRVAVEAQAMGRLVIAADHGGARETVVHGETGFLVAPGDAAALAEAIDRALSLDAAAAARMAGAARARVRARYSIEAMQRATLAIYERVTGRRFGAGHGP